MNDLNNWGRVLISIVVVVGFIAITFVYMTRKLEGAPVPEILSILLGALATNFTNVVGYWIGSSSGSSSKDSALAAVAAKVPTVPMILIGFLVGAAASKAYLLAAVA